MSDCKDRILTALVDASSQGGATARPASEAASRPRRRMAVVAIGCVVVAVAGFMATRGRDGGIDVVQKAAAAITPRSNEILHYRLDGVRIHSPYQEVWQAAGPPLRYRNRAQGSTRTDSPCVFEFSGVFVPAGNTEVRCGNTWPTATCGKPAEGPSTVARRSSSNPATPHVGHAPANLALVSVEGARPGARIARNSPPSRGCAGG